MSLLWFCVAWMEVRPTATTREQKLVASLARGTTMTAKLAAHALPWSMSVILLGARTAESTAGNKGWPALTRGMIWNRSHAAPAQ